jgi:hypothetical protein
MRLALTAPFVLIRPVSFVGYLCSPQTAETGEGMGVAEITEDSVAERVEDEAMASVEDGIAEMTEDEATTSDEEGVAEAVNDMIARSRMLEDVVETSEDSIEVGVVDSIEDGELVDDAIVEETIEELGEAGCGVEKQDSSYKCAVRICLNPMTWDSGMLNK